MLAVRDAESVEEAQSYCLGPLCRTANARSAESREAVHPRAARAADFLPRRERFFRRDGKEIETRARDGYVRVKGMRCTISLG